MVFGVGEASGVACPEIGAEAEAEAEPESGGEPTTGGISIGCAGSVFAGLRRGLGSVFGLGLVG